MKKKKVDPTELVERGIVWECPYCWAYNLDLVCWEDFKCIGCGGKIYALAKANWVKRPK